jgi:diguanylate cyclase (GGDEF)-like protein
MPAAVTRPEMPAAVTRPEMPAAVTRPEMPAAIPRREPLTAVTRPDMAATAPAILTVPRLDISTAVTRPNMPAAARGPGTPPAVTRPEMPALRPSKRPSLRPVRDEWDEDTDVQRLSEAEAPPGLAAAKDRAVLVRTDGAHAGEVFSVDGSGVTLGRHGDSEVCIHDAGVSRHHARILPSASGFLVEDLDSRNGVFLRGERIDQRMLHDGDVVHIGPRVSFRFALVDAGHEDLLRQLYRSSTRDALTQAYNRRHFDERLHTEIAFALRHRSDISVILFDIDFFKKVNDEHGHPAGDAVLRHVAKVAMNQIRTEDVFARYGGEEFAVLLRGIDLAGCARAAERIRTTVDVLPAVYGQQPIPVTLSGGCASLSECDPRSGDQILSLADERLYAAKESGRNRVVAFD